MILTCPSCSAKYRVKDGMIPDSGKKVRCKKCKNVFRAYPEPKDPPEPESKENAATVMIDSQRIQAMVSAQQSKPKPATEMPENVVVEQKPPVVKAPKANSKDALYETQALPTMSSQTPPPAEAKQPAETPESPFEPPTPTNEAPPTPPGGSAFGTIKMQTVSEESKDDLSEFDDFAPPPEAPPEAPPVDSMPSEPAPAPPDPEPETMDEVEIKKESVLSSDFDDFSFELPNQSQPTPEPEPEPEPVTTEPTPSEEEGPLTMEPSPDGTEQGAFPDIESGAFHRPAAAAPKPKPASPAKQSYQARIEGNVYPNLALDVIERWIKEGRLLENDQIAYDGSDDYQAAETFSEIQPIFQRYFGGSPDEAEPPPKKKGFFAKLFGR